MGFFSSSSRAGRYVEREEARWFSRQVAATARAEKLDRQRARQDKTLAKAQRRGRIAGGRGGAAAGFDRWG